MSSGISVKEEVIAQIKDIKLNKTHKWATFGIGESNKEIDCVRASEEAGGASKGKAAVTATKDEDRARFQELVADLMANKTEPRYVIYDFAFTTCPPDNRKIQKLAFLFWCSDESSVKRKMIYASSKDAFKKAACDGIQIEMQANDASDLDYDALAKTVEQH